MYVTKITAGCQFFVFFLLWGLTERPLAFWLTVKWPPSQGLPTSSDSGYAKAEIILQIILQSNSCFSGSPRASCSQISLVEVLLWWRQVSDSWIHICKCSQVKLFVFDADEWGCETNTVLHKHIPVCPYSLNHYTIHQSALKTLGIHFFQWH